MSFSSRVKEELEVKVPKSRHCQIAELAGILLFCGKLHKNGEKTEIILGCENPKVIAKYFTLLNKTLNIRQDAQVEGELVDSIIATTKMTSDLSRIDPLIIQQTCCKRAFITGAFLVAGSITDPEKSYHFEIVSASEDIAHILVDALLAFDLEAKIAKRKDKWIVYLKEGGQIVDALRVMGASVSVMDIENVRIVKEMRNSINRKVNCEAANIGKTVNAAVRQVNDIEYIRDKVGLDYLPANLQEIAEIRLENPDTSLKDLGALLDPPIGKSGVNHRLRHISEIADKLREG